MSQISFDKPLQEILESRGISSSEVSFGNHTLRIGGQPPVRLDRVSAASIPFQGFTRSTKLTRADLGMQQTLASLLEAMGQEGGPDAAAVTKMLRTALEYQSRLVRLGSGDTAVGTLHNMLAVMTPAEREAVTRALTSDKAGAIELAMRREAALNPQAKGLSAMVCLLRDIQVEAAGLDGLAKAQNDVLSAISGKNVFDAEQFDAVFGIAERFADRLVETGRMDAGRKGDYLFRLGSTVENLSNAKLAALWQGLNSAGMDSYRESLMGGAKGGARKADMLFTLQGLVLKEMSNRVSAGRLDEEIAAHPDQREALEAMRPKPLTETSGSFAALRTERANDISAANLAILAEASARGATSRENKAGARNEGLARAGMAMTAQQAGDLLRSAPITINFGSRRLFSEHSILRNPDSPMENIWHLDARGVRPKGAEYLKMRSEIEGKYFPELGGHDVNPDERPTYGALNLSRNVTGAAHTYGPCCIVLKPEVARRSTYVFNDTFLAPKATVTQERIDALRNLCLAELPESCSSRLRDPESAESKNFAKYADDLLKTAQAGEEIRIEQLGTAIIFHKNGNVSGDDADAANETLSRLMVKVFCDRKDTRGQMATYDNIETLLDGMDELSTASIASALEQARRNAGEPRAHLVHNYIEAQVQGPIIPSRDFQEIIVDLGEIREGERDDAVRELMAFQNRTGVKLSFVAPSGGEQALHDMIQGLPSEIGGKASILQQGQVSQSERLDGELDGASHQYLADHRDDARIAAERQRVLDNADHYAALHITSLIGKEGMAKLFPGGLASLTAKQRSALVAEYDAMIAANKADTNYTSSAQIAEQAMISAVKKVLGLVGLGSARMMAKQAVFRELAKLPFASEEHRLVFRNWVMGARKIGSVEEFNAIHGHAMQLAADVKALMERDPAAEPKDLLRLFAGFYAAATPDFTKALSAIASDYGPDDLLAEFDRSASLAASMLTAGNDAMLDGEQADRFFRLAADPELRRDLAIMHDQVREESGASRQMQGIATSMMAGLSSMARRAGRQLEFPSSSDLDPRFLGDGTRGVLRDLVPGADEYLEPFGRIVPAPRPDVRPAEGVQEAGHVPGTHAERREFLTAMLDQHLAMERNGAEPGRNTHGRGHIARVFIYGNAMAGFMEERGVQVDRNLLLCSIAGHDSGRTNGGDDVFERQSAANTVATMRRAIGASSLGQAFEAEIADLIVQHGVRPEDRPHPQNVATVERMLLSSADSMDYGRIRGMQFLDLSRNALVRPLNGDPRPSGATEFLEKLAGEADLLQKLTDPYCRFLPQVNALNDIIQNPDSTTAEIDAAVDRKAELQAQIAAEFERQQNLDSRQYMALVESVIRDNSALFPTLGRYYFTEASGNAAPEQGPALPFDAARTEAAIREMEGNAQAEIASRMNMPDLLAPGEPVLEGSALASFLSKFRRNVESMGRAPGRIYASERELVAAAFAKAYADYAEPRKAVFRRAAELEFGNPAQKAAFMRWVHSASAIRSTEELEVMYGKSMDAANRLKALADRGRLAPEDLMREMREFFLANDPDVAALLRKVVRGDIAPDDTQSQYTRFFSMAWSLLSAGEPPMLSERRQARLLNAIESMGRVATALRQAYSAGRNLPGDEARLREMLKPSELAVHAILHRAGRDEALDGLGGDGGVRDLPRGVRRYVREIAPETAARLNIA